VVQGVLTSEKLGTPIDSKLLIYCLQADYILSRIWVYISKMLFTPLLLSTMVATSLMLVALLCTVDMTARLSVALLSSVVMAPQPLDVSLWFAYVSLQSIVNQLSSLQCVNQLSSELGGSRSELHLLSAFGLPTPLVSVPVSMTHCPIVSVMSPFGTCLALV
jgi:hypothetical protein